MNNVFILIVIDFECQILQISFWYCLNSSLIKTTFGEVCHWHLIKRIAHLFELQFRDAIFIQLRLNIFYKVGILIILHFEL